MDPVTSMTMIEKAKSGDNDAWIRLTNIYGPLVHKQCDRKGLNAEDAIDVTWAVFRNVYEKLSTFRRDRESDGFLKFLRTITTRRIADHLRREERRQDKAVGGADDWFHAVAAVEADPFDEAEDVQMESLWSIEDVMTSLEAQIWRAAPRSMAETRRFRLSK